MKKLLSAFFGTAAGLLLFSATATADYENHWRDEGNSLVGAWAVDTTIRFPAEDCATAPIVPPTAPNPFPAFHTYHAGGTMSESGSRASPAQRSPGHGVWERTGRNKYAYRLMFHSFDANGFLAATMDSHTDLVLSKDGETFDAVSRFVRINLDGSEINFCATMSGQRITL